MSDDFAPEEAVDAAPAEAADWTADVVDTHTADEPATDDGGGGEPAPPAWQGPSLEEWQATQQALSAVVGTFEAAEQEAQAQARSAQIEEQIAAYLGDELDPGYDDRVAQMQAAMLRQVVEQEVAPYREFVAETAERQTLEEADSQADDLLVERLSHLDGLDLNDDGVRDRLREMWDGKFLIYADEMRQLGIPDEHIFSPDVAVAALEDFVSDVEYGYQRAQPHGLLDIAHWHAGTAPPAGSAAGVGQGQQGTAPWWRSIVEKVR